MATKKKPARSSRMKNKGDKSATGAQGQDGVLSTNDIAAEQASASDDFVAAMPYNSIKSLEYGHYNAVAPPPGVPVEPGSSMLYANTMTREAESAKTGAAARLDLNASIASLGWASVDASD